MKESVTVIPIHGDMFISIKNLPGGTLNKSRIKNMKKIFEGCDYEKIKQLLSLSNYADLVSVGMVQKV